MDKATLDAHSNHAWTLAILVWVVGAAGLYLLHHLIGDIRDRDVRWWLDAGLYVLAFFYFLAVGPLHSYFLRILCEKHGSQ